MEGMTETGNNSSSYNEQHTACQSFHREGITNFPIIASGNSVIFRLVVAPMYSVTETAQQRKASSLGVTQ